MPVSAALTAMPASFVRVTSMPQAGRFLVVAHGLERIAEAAAVDDDRDDEADDEKAEHEQRVGHPVAKDHVRRGRAGTEREAARAAGQALEMVGERRRRPR